MPNPCKMASVLYWACFSEALLQKQDPYSSITLARHVNSSSQNIHLSYHYLEKKQNSITRKMDQ